MYYSDFLLSFPPCFERLLYILFFNYLLSHRFVLFLLFSEFACFYINWLRKILIVFNMILYLFITVYLGYIRINSYNFISFFIQIWKYSLITILWMNWSSAFFQFLFLIKCFSWIPFPLGIFFSWINLINKNFLLTICL